MIIGRNSGVSPTASASANSSDSSGSRRSSALTRKTNSTSPMTVRMITMPNARAPQLELGRRRLLDQRVRDGAELGAPPGGGHDGLADRRSRRTSRRRAGRPEPSPARFRPATTRRSAPPRRRCSVAAVSQLGIRRRPGRPPAPPAGRRARSRAVGISSSCPSRQTLVGGCRETVRAARAACSELKTWKKFRPTLSSTIARDQRGVEHLAEQARDQAGGEQDQDQRIGRELDPGPQEREALASLDLVRPGLREALGGFGRGEPGACPG